MAINIIQLVWSQLPPESLIMEWQFTKSIHSSFMHIAINIPGIQLVWSQLPPDVSFLNTIHTQTVLIIFSMTARAASKV